MAIEGILNRETIKSTMKETFMGAGIGALAGHAVNLLPAARMATPAGMVFGVVFSVSRIINDVVAVPFKKMFEIFGLDFNEMGKGAQFARFSGCIGLYVMRGALAFGVTTLLLPGFTFYSGLALTGVIFAVDVISEAALSKNWML